MAEQDFTLFLGDVLSPFQRGIVQSNTSRLFVMSGKIKLLAGIADAAAACQCKNDHAFIYALLWQNMLGKNQR